jgi:hypothetical protein
VVVWWAVGVAGGIPPGREDEDISERSGGITRLGSQDGEDGRINVIDGNGTDVDEFGEIVLVWGIVSGPSDDIKGSVLLERVKVLAAKLVDHLPLVGVEVVGSGGVEEVAGIGKTVRAEGTELGKFKVGTPDFEHVAAGGTVDQDDLESETTGNDTDLTRFDPEFSEFGSDIEDSLLRNNQIVTIAVDVGAVVHALVAHVCVCGNAFSEGRFTGAGNGFDTSNKVNIVTFRDIERKPRELGGADMDFGVERKEASLSIWVIGHGVISLMSNGGSDTVEPSMLVHVTRRNESSTGDLFRIKAESSILRAVLTIGEGSGDGFAGVLVSESLLISVRISRTSRLGGFRISKVELCSNKMFSRGSF